jgi:WD40 repeat protein
MVRVWMLDGKSSISFKAHNGAVLDLAVSPDGMRIVTGGFGGTIRLWTADGKSMGEA